jgi:hypothetical protein
VLETANLKKGEELMEARHYRLEYWKRYEADVSFPSEIGDGEQFLDDTKLRD